MTGRVLDAFAAEGRRLGGAERLRELLEYHDVPGAADLSDQEIDDLLGLVILGAVLDRQRAG